MNAKKKNYLIEFLAESCRVELLRIVSIRASFSLYILFSLPLPLSTYHFLSFTLSL